MFGIRFLVFVFGFEDTVASLYKPQVLIARMLQESGNKNIVIDSIGRLGEFAQEGSRIAEMPQMNDACAVVARSHIELIALANARLYEEGITSASIEILTPLANLHTICGSQLNPVLKQAIMKHRMIREAVRRNPEVVTLNGGATGVALDALARMDPYYLILGGIKKGVIAETMNFLFPPSVLGTLFTQNIYDNSWGFNRGYLASRDSVVLRAAGRLLGLSVVQSIPLGRTLSQEVLEILLGRNVQNDPTGYIRLGFHDIIPDDRQFRLHRFISPTDLGMILRGSMTPLRETDLESAITVINQDSTQSANKVMRWLFSFVEGHVDEFLKLVTNCNVAPLGGLRLITPPMKVIVYPYNDEYTSAKPDEHNNILNIPRYPTSRLLQEDMTFWMQ